MVLSRNNKNIHNNININNINNDKNVNNKEIYRNLQTNLLTMRIIKKKTDFFQSPGNQC